MMHLRTFGYKYGPPTCHPTLDCRVMRNPHAIYSLRSLTGMDQEVQDYVRKDPSFRQMLKTAKYLVTYGGGTDTLNIGCVGGRHRSVAMAEILAAELRAEGMEVTVEHTRLKPLLGAS